MVSNLGGLTEVRGITRYLHVHLPSGIENIVALTGVDVTVGKSEKNTVVVDDPAVSSTHALFRSSGHEWMIVDLASRNGVFVNHHRISGSCIVRPGDVIQIGQCRLAINTRTAAASRPKKRGRGKARAKKKRIEARTTYIKLSGAILAKVVGPIVTVLLGLLVSGHFLLTCGKHDDPAGTAAPERRIVLDHDSQSLDEPHHVGPSHARRRDRTARGHRS